MKYYPKYWCLFIFCLSIYTEINAQFPYWDLRSRSTYTVSLGFGYNLNKQNSRLYFFSEIDVCLSCKRKSTSSGEFEVPLISQLENHIKRNRNKLSFNGRFQFYRNFRLYDRNYTNGLQIVNPNGQIYTIENEIGLRFTHYNLGEIEYDKIADPQLFSKNKKWNFSYGIRTLQHTGSQSYLSNFIGFYRIGVSELFDHYGIEFGWLNDGPVHMSFTKWLLPVFDHGLTNELYLEAYFRPWLQKVIIPEESANTEYVYRNDGVLKLRWYHQIITDRNIGLNFPNLFSRNGMYKTLDQDAFHYYRGFALSYEGGFTRERQDLDELKSHLLFKLKGELLQDNLKRGLQVQRLIHQGLAHRSVYKRRNSFIQNWGIVDSPLFPWELDNDFYRYYPWFTGLEAAIFYNAK